MCKQINSNAFKNWNNPQTNFLHIKYIYLNVCKGLMKIWDNNIAIFETT